MIEPAVFIALKEKKPFEPFRVHTTEGLAIDVVGRWKFVAMEDQLFVAFPDGKRWKMIPYGNIARVETAVAV